MEPLRKRALIDAAITEIGRRGSLDVTVSQIATRAGVSSALAHHYFGGKNDLLRATMQHLLGELSADMRAGLRRAATPRDRVSTIIAVSFSEAQFRTETVAAWLAFYVEAQKSPAMRRLLRIYARRLHSNLMSGLADLLPRPAAETAAEGVAALIDGLYIRHALKEGEPDAVSAIRLVQDYFACKLKGSTAKP